MTRNKQLIRNVPVSLGITKQPVKPRRVLAQRPDGLGTQMAPAPRPLLRSTTEDYILHIPV